jgi:large subunit ribosomal protein L22
MKALLSNCHQSPRKVRLVANAVRGKSIPEARALLSFSPNKSAPVIAKLIDSAVANARVAGIDTEGLFVRTIAVNKGMVMRRYFPRSRGRATRYEKTTSIVNVELGSHNTPALPAPAKSAAKKTVAVSKAKTATKPRATTTKKTTTKKPTAKATTK